MVKALISAAVLGLSGAASTAMPVASLNVPFTPYSASGPVGNDGFELTEVQWILESTGLYAGLPAQSWMLVWDPIGVASASGSIRFDTSIVAVFQTRQELVASASFESAAIAYDYRKVFVGLEPADAAQTSWSDREMTIRWTAVNPGDHVRVLTVVPEPGTWAMFAAGLLGIGLLLRRRSE